MKMARADEKDIAAAGDLLVILNDLSSGRYPVIGEPADDTPEWFDADDRSHLRHLHNLLSGILDRAPGFQGRVIAGMCYVILYSENGIVDLTADTLELHPDHVRNAVDAARYRMLRMNLKPRFLTSIGFPSVPYPGHEAAMGGRWIDAICDAALKREDQQ